MITDVRQQSQETLITRIPLALPYTTGTSELIGYCDKPLRHASVVCRSFVHAVWPATGRNFRSDPGLAKICHVSIFDTIS